MKGRNFEYFCDFPVFELNGGTINSNDGEPIYHAAVISSLGYPKVDNVSQGPNIYIKNMPVGTYITYTLLTPAETSFNQNQHVEIDDYSITKEQSDRHLFNSDLSSPFSVHHIVRWDIEVMTSIVRQDNPVFLLKYTGKIISVQSQPGGPCRTIFQYIQLTILRFLSGEIFIVKP